MRLLSVLLVLAACHTDKEERDYGDPIAAASPKLRAFASCDDLRAGLVDSFVEQLVQSRYGYGWAGGVAEDSAGDADSGGGESPSDYSTTNVQELGVDEPDIVKTDGDYLYVVQQGMAEL